MSALSLSVRNWFVKSDGALISPGVDMLLAGGLSIVAYVFLVLFADNIFSSSQSLLWVIYYLSFLVNYPHFTASYELIYRDLGGYFYKDTANKKFTVRLWWAGVIVPIILLGYFVFALGQESSAYMGYLINAMFFFVGWHYVKQIFGCVVVLSAAKKVFYAQLERYVILASLYMLWGVAYVSNNLYFGINDFYGLEFTSILIPVFVYEVFTVALVAALTAMFGLLLKKIFMEKKYPPLSAAAAYVAIFLWLHPLFADPYFFLLIPFFHSLQYLLFVGAYKRNQARALAANDEDYSTDLSQLKIIGLTMLSVVVILFPALVLAFYLLRQFAAEVNWFVNSFLSVVPFMTPAIFEGLVLLLVIALYWVGMVRFQRRKPSVSPVAFFFIQVVIWGVLLFSLIPTAIDALALRDWLPGVLSYSPEVFGATLYLFFFTIFINIHHYFVDNVIWGRDNPNVRAYLFSK